MRIWEAGTGMLQHWSDSDLTYTGEQLASLWAFRTFGLQGDSIVAFAGPCRVGPQHMVDLADVRAKAFISSERMLHFIVEHFDVSLRETVARQRLLVALAGDLVRAQAPDLARRGDDLYLGERKLSVSIATASPVSTLIHLGLNVSSAHTPVPTVGLDDLRLEPECLAWQVMDAYVEEMAGIEAARRKVKGVP